MLAQTQANAESVLDPGDRIVFIGDSITLQGEAGWVKIIERTLKAQERWQDYTIVPIASSGHTVGTWRRIESDSKTKTIKWGWNGRTPYDVGQELNTGADVLVIMLGMNDVLSPQVRDTPEAADQWKASYGELVQALKACCSPRGRPIP